MPSGCTGVGIWPPRRRLQAAPCRSTTQQRPAGRPVAGRARRWFTGSGTPPPDRPSEKRSPRTHSPLATRSSRLTHARSHAHGHARCIKPHRPEHFVFEISSSCFRVCLCALKGTRRYWYYTTCTRYTTAVRHNRYSRIRKGSIRYPLGSWELVWELARSHPRLLHTIHRSTE